MDTPPSLNVTLPMGMPEADVTVATKVTLWPHTEGLEDELSAVVVERVLTAKFAVTLFGASITMVCGFAEPDRSPVNPVNRYPAVGAAVSVAGVPESNHPPVVTAPPALGLADVVSRNCVLKKAVYAAAPEIVTW